MVSGLLQSLKTLGWICLVALLFCYACVGKPRRSQESEVMKCDDPG